MTQGVNSVWIRSREKKILRKKESRITSNATKSPSGIRVEKETVGLEALVHEA